MFLLLDSSGYGFLLDERGALKRCSVIKVS
jgi:hypothetical protein